MTSKNRFIRSVLKAAATDDTRLPWQRGQRPKRAGELDQPASAVAARVAVRAAASGRLDTRQSA